MTPFATPGCRLCTVGCECRCDCIQVYTWQVAARHALTSLALETCPLSIDTRGLGACCTGADAALATALAVRVRTCAQFCQQLCFKYPTHLRASQVLQPSQYSGSSIAMTACSELTASC